MLICCKLFGLFAKTLATGANVFELVKEKIVVRLFQANELAWSLDICISCDTVENWTVKFQHELCLRDFRVISQAICTKLLDILEKYEICYIAFSFVVIALKVKFLHKVL